MKENENDDDLEYHLEEPDEDILKPNKNSGKIKVLFTILIILTILLAGTTAYFIYRYKDRKDYNNEKGSNNEKSNIENIIPSLSNINESKQIEVDSIKGFPYWETFGTKTSNISYVKDNIVFNSFKLNGENYIKEIGDINNGNDYKKNERNVYDLYMPYIATQRKDKNNKILLLIHGGFWQTGNKEMMEEYCKMYVKYGIITVSMEYTLIDLQNNETNVFRILDEITATINSIKDNLTNLGFDEKKLELAIGGHSAGAHLSLLYAYLVKNIPLPIKFVLNLCGPVTLDLEYYYKPKDNNQPLKNIEQIDIDEAFKSNKIEYLYHIKNVYQLSFLNNFIGNKFNDSQLNSAFTNGTLNKESDIYIKMIEYLKYVSPFYYVNENTIPTICLYSGLDSSIGIGHYSLLKKKFEEKNNNNTILIYSKYTDHNDYNVIKTYNGLKAMKTINLEVLNHFK